MATLADSLISSSSRPLTLRMRPDLSARQQRYHGRAYWVVKEPVGLNYFRFHEEEYAILQMMDGHSSLEIIKERFEREFTPQKITFQDLQQFVGMLHRSGLVISEAAGQGKQLRKRRDTKKRRELLGKFTNVFALRFRGIDPERLLNWMLPYTRWFFSPLARLGIFMLALTALMLVLVQFDVFQSRLPAFHEFFAAKNWIFLAVAMGAVKVLHEFGHGLSCKYYGGECHEMGAMLLVFTPCLYCNVSDSWMLPSKWHRAFIGFSGMYVEIFISSICTFLWWFSEPGMLNHLCLSMMFICSVSTILFNGNPLLRFDGYYILMDILEIPNLRQKSTEVFKRFMTHLCLGIEQPDNPFLPQENRFWFGMYTCAAVVYRWVVVLSIMWFLNKVLEPYGLQVLGRLIACVGFFGLVVQPLFKLYKFFRTPGSMTKVKKHRLAATVAVIGAVAAFVIFVPMPFHVACTVEVRPDNAESIYAVVPGRLADVRVKPGQEVKAGDTLAVLENDDLQLTMVSLAGQRAEQQVQLNSLLRQRIRDDRAFSEIPKLEESLETLDEQIAEKQMEMDRLTLRAPIAGTILPLPPKPEQKGNEGQLSMWSGSPFARKNKGAWLQRSDAFCQVGNPQTLKAVLIIDQSDIDLVKLGDEVDIKLDSWPDDTLKSQVAEVSSSDLKVLPSHLASQTGGSVDAKTDQSSGQLEPLRTSYQAKAPLAESDRIFQTGLRGKAKVYTGWQPLGKRLYRYVARTFHFEL